MPRERDWRSLAGGSALLLPLAAYLTWNALLGGPFHSLERIFFGRGFLLMRQSLRSWYDAWRYMVSGPLPGKAHFLIEFTAIVLGLGVGISMLRHEKVLAVYGLCTYFISLTSGFAQGMHRYILAVPALFLMPARWGRKQSFDRLWTLACILWMGVLAAMFSFDFWAG